jgi:hypothetical protein
MDTLDLISLDNIDILNEWIYKESSLLDGEDISWETIEAPCLLELERMKRYVLKTRMSSMKMINY